MAGHRLPVHPGERRTRAADAITRAFEQHVTDAKLPRVRLHSLRHGHATLMFANGAPVKLVQERLGHAKASTTLELYGHVMPGMQEEAAAKVAAVVLGQ